MTRDERKTAAEKEARDKTQRLHDEIVAEAAKRGGVLDPEAEPFDPDSWNPQDYFHFAKDAAGPKVSVPVKYTAEHSGRFTSREATGKVRVKVGDYGGIRQFPDRTKGHNVAGIVQAICDKVATAKAQRVASMKREKAEDAAYARAEAINKRCGVAYVTGYGGQIRPDGAHAVVKDCRIELDHDDLTEAEVELVLAYIVTIKKKCPGC